MSISYLRVNYLFARDGVEADCFPDDPRIPEGKCRDEAVGRNGRNGRVLDRVFDSRLGLRAAERQYLEEERERAGRWKKKITKED